MKIILLLIVLVVGLIAAPNLAQKAQDWVSSLQQRASDQSETAASPASFETTQDLRLFMLDLINQDRTENGLTPVDLGSNTAAQVHAEELFKNGFLGHWGLDGMKPYMRYTLAGGEGYEAENVSGSNRPRIPGARYVTTQARDSLRAAQQGLMASPGHRRNILNSSHDEVNLGIACDDVDCAVVQQFESNYIQFDRVPEIESGQLWFSGRTVKGFTYKSAQIWYDALPMPLQAAQIRTTFCYDSGTPIVFVRPPAPLGVLYREDSVEFSWPNCRDPGNIDPPSQAARTTTFLPDLIGRVPWEDASAYHREGNFFEVRVDIAEYLAQYGEGVYTVILWGERDESSNPLTNYSIFVPVP